MGGVDEVLDLGGPVSRQAPVGVGDLLHAQSS